MPPTLKDRGRTGQGVARVAVASVCDFIFGHYPAAWSTDKPVVMPSEDTLTWPPLFPSHEL